MNVRTRFAPSPTGFQHVGGMRTALFAWLVARQAGGQFILRLEDTDKKREVAGADQHLIDSLNALGLDHDEGPDIGGPYGPYRQSQRLDRYKEWAGKLIEKGRAYADSRTPDELDQLRADAKSKNQPFLIRNYPLDDPPAWDGSQPLRFKSEPKAYAWHDEVMGDLSTGPEVIDDFILIKSDGYPTYNFAHIIDDFEMKISHVIRGQEFIASVPNYLNLYDALGFERPVLATMPHILGPTGNKKLSKRDGAKDVLDYIRDGFLPAVLCNFIASLGWNDGTTQEIYTKEELIKKFNLSRVQKSGARFDEQRLLWLNGSIIRDTDIDELAQTAEPFWPDSTEGSSPEYKKAVLSLIKDRLKYFAELPELTSFFFEEPHDKAILELYGDTKNQKMISLQPKDSARMISVVITKLEDSDFSPEDLKSRMNQLLEELDTTPRVLFTVVRIALTGVPFSPELFGTMHVLGKERTLARLQKAGQLLDAG